MPRAFVTGGTGFVGYNLLRLLRGKGWDVVAIHRAGGGDRLAALGVEVRRADIADESSLRAAMPEGVDCVFHVAGSTSFWRGGNAAQTRVNVDGTRHVVRAALSRRARRLVHTSSVSAYGEAQFQAVITEESPSDAGTHWVNYFRTKWLGEGEVRAAIAEGLDATIVNPTNILGPHDDQSWARLFRLARAGKLPGIPPGAADWAHVDDIAAGHLAAYEKGRTGENYLLGGPHASYAEVLTLFAGLAGVRAPRVVPAFFLKSLARVKDLASRATRREPDVTPESAHVVCGDMRADCRKAERELGYSTVPVARQVEDTWAWIKSSDAQ